MASPNPVDDEFESVSIDPAQPLKGIIVCCTSIPPDQRVCFPRSRVPSTIHFLHLSAQTHDMPILTYPQQD